MKSESETTFKVRFKNLWNSFKTRSRPNRKNILISVSMAAIIATAILVRIQPMAWGITIQEFDPWFHYEVTQHIVDNGFGSFFSWHQTREWYPSGRNIATTAFPGLYFAGAALYELVRALGLNASVMDVAIVFPVLMAAITCVVMFFLGREVAGIGAGLLSALFLALNPTYIGRTTLGWYGDETIGMLCILSTFLFYLRALKSENKLPVSLLYSVAAGLSLGYVYADWGGAKYPLGAIVVFTFLLVIFTKISGRRVIMSYGTLMFIGLSMAASVPKLGIEYLRSFECIAAAGVFLFLLLNEASKLLAGRINRLALLSISIIVLGGGAIALSQLGVITLPWGKFMSVINPFTRSDNPLINSVQEHRVTTWASFYYDFGALVFLAPLGMFFAFRRLNYQKLFVLVFGLTALYFAASMVRLEILLAPAFAILGALAIVEIFRPFSSMMFSQDSSRRRRRLPKPSKGFTVLLIIVVIAITFLPLTRGVNSAYSPTTLAASSIPSSQSVGDWMQALSWMKSNLPPDAIVACWWDYGYWVSVIAGKITLADNGTINATSLANLGKIFMSTENDSLPILKSYNAGYVLVFTTINQAQGGNYLFGDEVKWRWMAQIGWNNNTADTPLEDTSITSLLGQSWSQSTTDTTLLNWYTQFETYALPKNNTVLTELMIYGAFNGAVPGVTPQHFQLVYASDQRFVLVYKVVYP